MFPLQGGKIKQKIPLDNKDKLDKTFDNFKRLALAYEQYVNKAVEKVKDIEDLQYLKISTVENFENIFDNWDKFEAGMPASIKEIFRSSVSIRLDNETINITPEDFKRMTREIPLNMTAADYPVQTLEKILKNSNIKLDKVSTTVRKTKGQQFQDMIRANTVSEIVKDIVSESSQQKVHQEYFDKLIKEDAEQFYSIKANAETISDSADRKNVLACYDYVIKYKKACIEGIRKTLDSYEIKLKEFLIKLAQKSRDEESYKKISTIMQSFVNYKNDPQAFLQIMFNMKADNKLKEKMQAKVNTVITEVRQGEAGQQQLQGYYNIDLKATTEQQLTKVFKLATQGIVDYINLDQGLLQQFSKQMKAIVPVDFTEIILDVFINYIMLCAIQFGNNTTVKFDLNVLSEDYDVFKSKSGLGLMMRAKNVLTILKNANDNAARAVVLGAANNGNDQIVNNVGNVIAGANVDANGVVTLGDVNITGARINGNDQIVNNAGAVIARADVDADGVITLGDVNITGARVSTTDDGEVLKRLIDNINDNTSAKTILGLAGNDVIRGYATPANMITRLTENNNALLDKILDKLPELERVLQKSTSKNRTEYILYRMIDNMIKSIYGTIILIIQAHSKEDQNIYTLLGSSRRRLRGGVQNGVECKSDCFSTYVLLYRLHKLFVYQATKIFFRKDYQYADNALYGDAAANQEPTEPERKQIYSIIQITRTSKFYDLFKCLVAHGTDTGMGDNFEEYFRCINALWEQVPGSTTGILSERAHNLLTQYVQELINNMIVTLQTLQNPNISDKVGVQDTFNRIESKSIDGINTFDRITNTEDYDTRIIVEERDKIKPDDVLELYMAINYQIQKFTEVYVEQHKDEYFQLQLYKDAILQELQSQKNIWLAKTEDQKKLYANGVDEDKFKKQYLVHLITANNLFESIKTGFDKYSEDFGLQYKQLKFIQLRIMDLLYSYHKQYVEKYNNITVNNGIVANGANFNNYFLEAVKQLYTSTKDYVYKIFLLYNGVNLAEVQRAEEHNLSYRATQLIQNSEFVKMKIYMFFLEQLESKISVAIQAGADQGPNNNRQNEDINNYLTTNNIPEAVFEVATRTAKNLCKILIKLGVIEQYQAEEHKNAAYDKHQMPFMICFRNAAGAVFDPPKDDMKPKKTLAAIDNNNTYGNKAWIYMIITKNFYNYFQQHNTYLKNFCVNTLAEYTRSVEMLKCIPMLEIRDGEIDASKVYNFLTEAKNAVLEIYDKTNSIYTKQEIKDVIRHQLDLSLDIVPVLKDAFEKFVLPVQTYYNTIRYDLGRLNQGWFTSQEYKLHVYGLDEIKYQPLGHVKSLINKTSTDEDGQEVVNTTYKNCKLLAGKVQFRTNKIQADRGKTEDYELDIVKTLNKKIAEVHDLLFQTYHTIPKEFRDKVLSNDVIRQSSELTDIQSGDTVFQLPLTSVQMPFQTEITSLDLSIKDQQTIIDNMLNMNEVDKYMLNDEITYLTSAMMQFMQLTYGQNGSAYSQIPRPVKSQYINLFRKLFNKEAIADADLPQDFNWKNLFKRAIDGRNMLNNNVLAVARYGQANQQGVRPVVGDLTTDVLQRVFGKDNRTNWANWTVAQNNNNESTPFITAINILCTNQLRLIEALAFGVNGENRVQADDDDNINTRHNGLNVLINQFTEFNLVNFLIGMTYYRKNVSSQIKKGLENLYVPENANWDNLRMVKAYNHQQVSYLRFDNSQGAYNALTGNIDIQSLHYPKTNAERGNGGKNEHYEFKFRSYAEYIQYLTNRIQQNAGRENIKRADAQARVPAQNGQNEIPARNAENGVNIGVEGNDRLGINDDRYTQIDVEDDDKPFAVFTNQNLYRAFLVDLMKTVVLEFPAGENNVNRNQNLAKFNRLVSQQNPIVIPMQIPTKKSIEDQTILQSAYAKGFVDSVAKIISDYHDKQELAVIYDQRTQKIELFDQATYVIEQTELPILYMNNILALQDDQKEITILSEERKIEITYDLIEKIRDLETALIEIQNLQTPAINIYRTYISACKNIVDEFMSKFDWNNFFDTKFDKRYFNLQHFLELDKVLRQSDSQPGVNDILATTGEAGVNANNFAANIDVVRYKSDILTKFLHLILLKGINTLKAYDGKQLAGQVYKNFNYYLGIVGSDKYHTMIWQGRINQAIRIKNTQFMRLTFVKRLTSEKRIIGEDHYWVNANQIQILKDQTRFVPTNPAGDNEYYLPDWQTVLQGQRNYRNKVARKMLSYNGEYVNVLYNDLHVFDIRRIPYMQQYTSQPYVYNVIVDTTPNDQINDQVVINTLKYRGQGRGGHRYLRGGAIDIDNDVLNTIGSLTNDSSTDNIKDAIKQVAIVVANIIIDSSDVQQIFLLDVINNKVYQIGIDAIKFLTNPKVINIDVLKNNANNVQIIYQLVTQMLNNGANVIAAGDNLEPKYYTNYMLDRFNDIIQLSRQQDLRVVNQNIPRQLVQRLQQYIQQQQGAQQNPARQQIALQQPVIDEQNVQNLQEDEQDNLQQIQQIQYIQQLEAAAARAQNQILELQDQLQQAQAAAQAAAEQAQAAAVEEVQTQAVEAILELQDQLQQAETAATQAQEAAARAQAAAEQAQAAAAEQTQAVEEVQTQAVEAILELQDQLQQAETAAQEAAARAQAAAEQAQAAAEQAQAAAVEEVQTQAVEAILELQDQLQQAETAAQETATRAQNQIQELQNQLTVAQNERNAAINQRNAAQNINTSYQRQNRINRGAINNNFATYAVIPQHLMDEMSMNTGLTNISTVNVAVQLTFDISKISNTLDTYLGQLKRYEDGDNNNRIVDQNTNTTGRQDYLTHYIEQFYTLRQNLSTTLNDQAALRNVVINLFNDFLTDPVIFSYNIATHQNKHLSRLINEYRQNTVANNMKLFNILDLQPFHPIQLIKDNSIYQIMTVFGIYVNKYNNIYITDNTLIRQDNDNNMYKQLNHTTKYGQKIYIKYQITTPVGVDEDQRLTNRKPVILHKDGTTVVYYKQQNGQDVIIRVEYEENSKEIETHDQLQHLLDRHDMEQYGINITAWNEQIIDSNLILGARIIADNENVPNDDAALTVIKQFKNDNHTMYQLVKYNGIVLAGNNRNIANVNLEANNKIPHLVLQIFDFIRHYNKLIQTNDATDKQGITYSQYHVVVTDENAANQIAYDQV